MIVSVKIKTMTAKTTIQGMSWLLVVYGKVVIIQI